MKYRLPAYMAEQPARLTVRYLGMPEDDPHAVLLAAAYRLAARLERRLSPWDSDSTRATSLDVPMGRMRVQLRAAITDPRDDEDGDGPQAAEGYAPVRTPGGDQRTVTLLTTDHGPVTFTEPSWCNGRHPAGLYRSDIAHASDETRHAIDTSIGPVYVQTGCGQSAFGTPEYTAPYLIAEVDATLYPETAEQLEEVAAALEEAARFLRTLAPRLAAIREEADR